MICGKGEPSCGPNVEVHTDAFLRIFSGRKWNNFSNKIRLYTLKTRQRRMFGHPSILLFGILKMQLAKPRVLLSSVCAIWWLALWGSVRLGLTRHSNFGWDLGIRSFAINYSLNDTTEMTTRFGEDIATFSNITMCKQENESVGYKSSFFNINIAVLKIWIQR